ncbi:hypothetical protein, partial [Pelagivirga sediminicola]|uniref:hypothetical protein n=1 Tax=Pelagivirga sediminicola TaxID=2170575 RepID=UPI001A9C84B2
RRRCHAESESCSHNRVEGRLFQQPAKTSTTPIGVSPWQAVEATLSAFNTSRKQPASLLISIAGQWKFS